MTDKNLRTVIFGVKGIALQAFTCLFNEGADIVAVVTTESPENARLHDAASRKGISVFHDACADALAPLQPERGLVFSYPRRIGDDVLELCTGGVYNFHPARLPDYRGCLPTVWPILNGDEQAECTVHRVVRDFDAGDVVYTRSVAIDRRETGYSLYGKLMDAEVTLLADHPQLWRQSRLTGEPQDESRAQYFRNRLPGGGRIDWTQPAVTVERFVRAVYHPDFRCAYTECEELTVEILDAELSRELAPAGAAGKVFCDTARQRLLIGCGDELLSIRRIRLKDQIWDEDLVSKITQHVPHLVHS